MSVSDLQEFTVIKVARGFILSRDVPLSTSVPLFHTHHPPCTCSLNIECGGRIFGAASGDEHCLINTSSCFMHTRVFFVNTSSCFMYANICFIYTSCYFMYTSSSFMNTQEYEDSGRLALARGVVCMRYERKREKARKRGR